MKKIIAAAVAAAIIAPASAMAAGPTLYGQIHTSIDNKDNNGSGAAGYDEWSLNSNSSRIGVKGSEDLGNGMTVGYLIEWGVDMDGDGGDLSERNRAVTLSGDWGTALAGKWDTPYKSVGRKTDLFGDRIGDTRNMNTGAMDARAHNVVAYVTPNMNGFSATFAYVISHPGGPDGATDESDAFSFNAIYNNGPMLIAFGYEDYSDGIVAGNDNQTNMKLAGSYAFGDFKVLGSWANADGINGNSKADADIWTIGGSYTMGNNVIKAQYADRGESQSKAKDGADMWVIGLDHKMSKRTTAYVAYASTSNDDNSASTSWGGGHDGEGRGLGAAGKDADSFSVGIIHKF
ncbi:MAG: porin [gamma proteobacterium symbiont of Taylorina sp.]|nr:porin [gamma proteobacterium symbiont of Taylorina sp.]